jgi:hypothetical protein
VLEKGRWVLAFAFGQALLSCGCTTSAARNGLTDAGMDSAPTCQDFTGPIPGMPIATFDTDTERFILSTASSDGTYTNLADPDAGVTPPASLSYVGTAGNPNPGSLELFAPFSGAHQALVAYDYYGCGVLHDWGGKVLRARIKMLEGTFTGAVLLYVGTSTTCATFDFGYAGFASLSPNSCWQELYLDLTTPVTQTAGYDPGSVVTFGIQFWSASTDAGASPATFLVDSFSIE